MAKITKDDIMKAVEDMTVLELSELVKALEEKFGVSAAPVAVAAAGGAVAADAGEPKEEQTVFNVVLVAAGENKIGAIKAVRELVPTLGLQEAKTLVESAPKEVLTGLNKSAAEEAKKKLEAAGAKAELK
jgi:large subunit ribosomal protein L7/L12